VPEDAPPDIPRLIMSSQDKKFKLELSPARMNLLRYVRSLEDEINVSTLVGFAKEISETYLQITKAIVGRMAILLARYVEEPNPGKALSKHFCKKEWTHEQPFNRPENFEIHAHKRFNLSDFRVNSWVRCKTGKLSMPNSDQQNIILVEQDINTLHEDMGKKEYKIKDIVNFWKVSMKELDKILDFYYPSVSNG